MVLAFVTAVIDPVLSSIHFAGPEITFNELWSVFLTVCALMFFCWKAPGLAAALLGGSPHLGADHLFQAASTPIAAGVALNAIGSRASAGVSATQAAASGGQGPSGRGPWGSAAASMLGGIAGGPSGAGGAAGSSASGAPGPASPSASSPSPSPRGASASLVLSSMGKPANSPTEPSGSPPVV